jgi:hypothetical protein
MDKDIEDFDREDFDPNEWGNIPLPGMTDEELHSKNWNFVSRNKEISKLPNWKKAQTKMLNERIKQGWYQKNGEKNKNNPVWRDTHKKAMNKRKGEKRIDLQKVVVAEGVEYESLTECAKHYGIGKSAMSEKVRGNNPNFYYKSPK